MKKLILSLLAISLLYSFSFTDATNPDKPKPAAYADWSLCQNLNQSVQSGNIMLNGKNAGSIISINRASGVKAKYFAYKQNGNSVHDRYTAFRSGKTIAMITSGAYSTEFGSSGSPVGLTIDDGNAVNLNYTDKMDGLVIVEQVGGVRVSNIEEGNLKVKVRNNFENIDIRQSLQRQKFIDWAAEEKATVFQTHLLIYDNQIKVGYANSEKSPAVRRVLVLGKNSSGQIYHFIIYTSEWAASLYDMADYTLKLLNSKGFTVVAAVNLDTGGVDVIAAHTNLKDCNSKEIIGKSNDSRAKISNMLCYYMD